MIELHMVDHAVDDMVWLQCPAVSRGKSPKLHRYWQGPIKVVRQITPYTVCITQFDWKVHTAVDCKVTGNVCV